MTLRIIGGLFLVLGLLALGFDLWGLVSTGTLSPTPLGTIWYSWHPDSLGLLQAAIQRYVWPPLWDPGITTLLLLPAWVMPTIIGGLVWLAGVTKKIPSSYDLE